MVLIEKYFHAAPVLEKAYLSMDVMSGVYLLIKGLFHNDIMFFILGLCTQIQCC